MHGTGASAVLRARPDHKLAAPPSLRSPSAGPTPRPAASRPPHRDDAALLAHARAARNGAKFAALYDAGDVSGYTSASEADLALCSLLAFWAGGNATRMDGLFRRSALMRPKWNEARGAETYGARTIATALARVARGRPIKVKVW